MASFDPTSALGALAGNFAYYGNPNNGGDPDELFAFINFFFTGGTTFDTIVVSDEFGLNTFESDNWTISADPGSVSGTPIGVPEPATITMLGIGVAGLAGYRSRRRKEAVAVA